MLMEGSKKLQGRVMKEGEGGAAAGSASSREKDGVKAIVAMS